MCLARQEITPADEAAHWHLPSAGGPSTLARQVSNPADFHASDTAPSSRDPLHVVRGTGPACAGGRRPETGSERRRKRRWRAHRRRRHRAAELAGARPHLRRAALQPAAADQRRNVEKLGLAWSYATGTHAGLEATPLVVDGVMYTTGVVERRRTRSTRRPAAELWTLRPAGAARVGTLRLLRRGEPRRRALEGQASTSARSTAG